MFANEDDLLVFEYQPNLSCYNDINFMRMVRVLAHIGKEATRTNRKDKNLIQKNMVSNVNL